MIVRISGDGQYEVPESLLGGSDPILPPDDISLAELAGDLSTAGLIPDWGGR